MTSRELYELLDHTGEACYATDPSGTIVYWGRSAEDCFGGTRKDHAGKRCWEVLGTAESVASAQCGEHCEFLRAAAALCPTPSQFVQLRAREETKWFSVLTFGAPVRDRPAPLVIHLCRDVDKMKLLSEAASDCINSVRRIMELNQPEPPRDVPLTSREIEVLALCAKGLSSKQIAKNLGIAPTTVRNHVQNILEKLECHSRIEAILRARATRQL